MKTFNIAAPDDRKIKASLYNAVDQLIKTSIAASHLNRNTIVNNISPSLYITRYEEVIISVIQRMLQGVVGNATDSVIYLSAKELYGNMIEMRIKDENCYNTYAVAVSLQDAVPMAAKIGGHLDITNQKQKITTIAFMFPFEKD